MIDENSSSSALSSSSSLFASTSAGGGTPLSSLKATYAIDCSGSTQGEILRREIMSAAMLMPFVAHAQTIGWNSVARRIASVGELRGEGGTYPSCIVPYLQGAQCLVLYTDGQIGVPEMEEFQRQMMRLPPLPIIIVFTMASNYTLESSTIAMLHAQVNMSIPEACLKLSNDVCIAVNAEGAHKVLMAKGAFNVFGKLPQLQPEMLLSALVDFDMTLLKGDTVCFRVLPSGQINLNGFSSPLILESLYASEDAPYAVLEALCDRVYFPKLDMTRMQAMLSRRLRALNENKEVDQLREELAKVAVDANKAGGEEHRALVARLREAIQRRGKQTDGDLVKFRTLLQRFLQMLAEYAVDRTSIALGSNRAMRAKQIDPTEFEEIASEQCATVPECPIFLQSGAACVLLQLPSLPQQPSKETVVEFCTSDNSMEGPFNFGRLLYKYGCVTRGLYCVDFARQTRQNPFSRAPIAGFVPLSNDPAVVMRFMSRLFGDSRELWHMVRAYIGMMTMHCLRDEWAMRDVVVPHLRALCDKYDCTYNLKGNTEDRRPLRACFEYVTQNYGACLRDRLPDDSRTILAIVDLLYPTHAYERRKVLTMLEVVDRFSRLLAQYKKDDCPSMLRYIIDVDEFEHCVKERLTIDSLIARILWYDSRSSRPQYRGLKLQLAIETAMQDRKFGSLLSKAFSGVACDMDCEAMRVALPEPSGDHFGEEKFGQWTEEGRPKQQCVYCGQKFQSSKEMYAHLREAYGKHNYNGQRDVLRAIQFYGVAESEQTLFKAAKQLLYRRYGEQCFALHTQRCKKMLLHFIRQFKMHPPPPAASSGKKSIVCGRVDFDLRAMVDGASRAFAEAKGSTASSPPLLATRPHYCSICRMHIYDDARYASNDGVVNLCKECSGTEEGQALRKEKTMQRIVNAW